MSSKQLFSQVFCSPWARLLPAEPSLFRTLTRYRWCQSLFAAVGHVLIQALLPGINVGP